MIFFSKNIGSEEVGPASKTRFQTLRFYPGTSFKGTSIEIVSNVKSKTQQSINNSYRIIYMNINYFDVFMYRQLYSCTASCIHVPPAVLS